MNKKPPENELSFRLLVKSVKDYAIFMLDPQGNVASWNEGAEKIKGYRAEEIIGQHMSRFYMPEDAKRGHPAHLLKLAETDGRVEDEGWRVRKDGTCFWAGVTITALRDEGGTLRGFGKVTRDLTDRKLAEQALSELSGKVLAAQDQERRRISMALTDNTSPSFASLVSKLYQVKKLTGRADDRTAGLIGESIDLAETLSRAISTVSYLLHAPDSKGGSLLPSLRWYLDGLAKNKNIEIEMDLPPTVGNMSHSGEVALFRLVQESFATIFGASARSQTRVRLAVGHELATLEVSDKELQLPPTLLRTLKQDSDELGVGITGMRQRFRQLGGKLEVDSAAAGTIVKATLPLAKIPGATATRAGGL